MLIENGRMVPQPKQMKIHAKTLRFIAVGSVRKLKIDKAIL